MSDPADVSNATTRWSRVPMALLIAVCVWNLWEGRAGLLAAAPFNDTSMHMQMANFATTSLQHGHWPWSQWYWPLNLGSPHFLHYQGMGAFLVGFFGLFFGTDGVFRLVTYLLIALWPAAVYSSGRTFGFDQRAATLMGIASAFVASHPGIGYEPKAYVWLGYGVWAQLCASWVLVFAWAWTWRALHDSRYIARAATLIALAAALHFETGYPALLALVVFVFFVKAPWRDVARRGGLILTFAAVMMAWVITPLLVYSQWAPLNAGQINTPMHQGYGIGQNLLWLVHGEIFDLGRWPVLTVAVGVALLANALGRRQGVDRRLLAMSTLFIVLFAVSWGPATWGAVMNIVPGHADIFFRRFLGPAQGAALFVMGAGLTRLLDLWAARRSLDTRRHSRHLALVAVLVVGLAYPATHHLYVRNDVSIRAQLSMQRPVIADVAPLLDYVRTAGDGRLYLGTQTNWGKHFTVGVGPADIWIVDQNVDQISSQGWAASLMEGPQALFDEHRLSNYQIFGVKYLILPPTQHPHVPADLIMQNGPYSLYQVRDVGYLSLLSVSGSADVNKATISRLSGVTLRSDYVERHVTVAVNYPSTDNNVILPTYFPSGPIGTVSHEHIDWTNGLVSAFVTMNEPGNLVVSTSFDPDWQVFVDGHLATTQMVSPALLSVPLSTGLHAVTFQYRGFRWMLPLVLLALVGYIVARGTSRRLATKEALRQSDASGNP